MNDLKEVSEKLNEFLKPITDTACFYCHKNQGIKTDSKGRQICRKCLNSGQTPFKLPSSRIGRNESCPCGSGKKFKKCCWTTKPFNTFVTVRREVPS